MKYIVLGVILAGMILAGYWAYPRLRAAEAAFVFLAEPVGKIDGRVISRADVLGALAKQAIDTPEPAPTQGTPALGGAAPKLNAPKAAPAYWQ